MQTSMDKLLSKVDSEKCVGIEISNKSSSIILSCPSSYCDSGFVHYPPSPSILPGTVEHCKFLETPATDNVTVDHCKIVEPASTAYGHVTHRVTFIPPTPASGTEGVLTYKLSGKYIIAIFFSNPYSMISHRVDFLLKIYTDTGKPIKNVYKEMKDESDSNHFLSHCNSGNETQTFEVSNDNVRVLATMTNTTKAVVRVHILDNNVGKSDDCRRHSSLPP
ncbi:hypothetical protein XENTR_v10023442 [Xenopus tropicalis]|uniref:Uncharacterized protein LOC101733691 n=1 Tax=Xenopus tropicalis TaxID=8364 RepID=A0A8J0R599_XENTR|eukprot:XP_004918228.1 PREDICTED: uncharacterized protein LOC101733691 [Xenopus tropicalis]